MHCARVLVFESKPATNYGCTLHRLSINHHRNSTSGLVCVHTFCVADQINDFLIIISHNNHFGSPLFYERETTISTYESRYCLPFDLLLSALCVFTLRFHTPRVIKT